MASIASMLIDETSASSTRGSPSFSRGSTPASFYGSETDIALTGSTGSSPVLSAAMPTSHSYGSRMSPSDTSSAALVSANRRRKILTSRPPNSFILYRSDKLRELIQKFPELKQTDISKMCAENWKNETPEVKELYRQKQQEAKTKFLSEQAIEVQKLSGNTDKAAIKKIQPTNTFIRYRTEMKKKLAKQFAQMNQKDVSRACGLMWRSEPEHVKMRYRQSYNQEKRDFERLCMTSAMEPSAEACAVLASVLGESAPAPAPVSVPAPHPIVTANLREQQRRISDCSFGGSYSAPVSPPQPAPVFPAQRETRASTESPQMHSATIHSAPYNAERVSLPSCASLLSIAGESMARDPRMRKISAPLPPPSHLAYGNRPAPQPVYRYSARQMHPVSHSNGYYRQSAPHPYMY